MYVELTRGKMKYNYMLSWVEGSASSTKKDGNLLDNSSIASSMDLARPTYDPEPDSGKDAVATGAFAITKSKSMFFDLCSGNA